MGLHLRPTLPTDVAWILAAERHVDNRRYITPWDPAQHEAAMGSAGFAHLTCEVAGAAEPVGFVILAGLDSPHRSVELRRIVMMAKGQGHGRTALREVQRRVFSDLGAHRLWLDVVEDNTRARRLYAAEGFREEGRLLEAMWDGTRFTTLVLMAQLAREYPPAAEGRQADRP